jgi:hypothetical protein
MLGILDKELLTLILEQCSLNDLLRIQGLSKAIEPVRKYVLERKYPYLKFKRAHAALFRPILEEVEEKVFVRGINVPMDAKRWHWVLQRSYLSYNVRERCIVCGSCKTETIEYPFYEQYAYSSVDRPSHRCQHCGFGFSFHTFKAWTIMNDQAGWYKCNICEKQMDITGVKLCDCPTFQVGFLPGHYQAILGKLEIYGYSHTDT